MTRYCMVLQHEFPRLIEMKFQIQKHDFMSTFIHPFTKSCLHYKPCWICDRCPRPSLWVCLKSSFIHCIMHYMQSNHIVLADFIVQNHHCQVEKSIWIRQSLTYVLESSWYTRIAEEWWEWRDPDLTTRLPSKSCSKRAAPGSFLFVSLFVCLLLFFKEAGITMAGSYEDDNMKQIL